MGWIIILLLCLPFANPRLFGAILMSSLSLYIIFSLIEGNLAPIFFGIITLLVLGALFAEPHER